jgi:hypothetical protein
LEAPETTEQEAPRQGGAGENARFWSLGAAAGSSFAAPWLTATVQRTYALFPYTLVELGLDFGFIHGYDNKPNMEYFSLYPFGHFMGFVPFGDRGGWFGGLGGGAMLAFYTTKAGETTPYAVPAFDVSTGLYLGKRPHYFMLAYTLRMTSEEQNSKVSLGYSYRFGGREGVRAEPAEFPGLLR